MVVSSFHTVTNCVPSLHSTEDVLLSMRNRKPCPRDLIGIARLDPGNDAVFPSSAIGIHPLTLDEECQSARGILQGTMFEPRLRPTQFIHDAQNLRSAPSPPPPRDMLR